MQSTPCQSLRTIAVILGLTIQTQGFAQVFKCNGPGGVSYQAQPCAANGGRIELRVHEPTERERAWTRSRAESEQRLIGEHEAEHERARLEADRERMRALTERVALDARCASYEAEIAKGRRPERAGRERAGRETPAERAERIRNAEARHFSECFGRR
jgi:hypothetical protein